ncbi:MAG: hypothetical protein GC150_08570 [Rhizobiales bacterium]|nr:hypothetical protein [Hyphomicrobiales bacterium]
MTTKSAVYWFKPRRNGYGAAPKTWQGWVAIIAFPAICAVVTLVLFATLPPLLGFVLFAIFMTGATLGFIAFVRRRTDGPWRAHGAAPSEVTE